MDTCHSFIDKLKQRGAQVVDIEIPYLEEMRVAHITTIVSEMLTGTAAMPRSKFSLPTRISLSVAEQNLKPSDYLLASKWKVSGD